MHKHMHTHTGVTATFQTNLGQLVAKFLYDQMHTHHLTM